MPRSENAKMIVRDAQIKSERAMTTTRKGRDPGRGINSRVKSLGAKFVRSTISGNAGRSLDPNLSRNYVGFASPRIIRH